MQEPSTVDPGRAKGVNWSVEFCIEAWEFWSPGSGAPPVQAMPPLLRRRASPMDRLALEVAYRLAPKGVDMPTVFASRHGEVARSVEMLIAMAKGEAPLPMGFSLSVHNAASGLFSIAREDRSASNSLASHRDLLPGSVLEACGQLEEGAPKVLLVAFDDELPEPYHGFADEDPVGYALGLMLSQGRAPRYRLSGLAGGGKAEAEQRQPQALALRAMLEDKKPELRLDEGPRAWLWQRLSPAN